MINISHSRVGDDAHVHRKGGACPSHYFTHFQNLHYLFKPIIIPFKVTKICNAKRKNS